LHLIRTGVALVACAFDENGFCFPNSLGDRGSGHFQADLRHRNSGFCS